jgi:hypothetical protein
MVGYNLIGMRRKNVKIEINEKLVQRRRKKERTEVTGKKKYFKDHSEAIQLKTFRVWTTLFLAQTKSDCWRKRKKEENLDDEK